MYLDMGNFDVFSVDIHVGGIRTLVKDCLQVIQIPENKGILCMSILIF